MYKAILKGDKQPDWNVAGEGQILVLSETSEMTVKLGRQFLKMTISYLFAMRWFEDDSELDEGDVHFQ